MHCRVIRMTSQFAKGRTCPSELLYFFSFPRRYRENGTVHRNRFDRIWCRWFLLRRHVHPGAIHTEIAPGQHCLFLWNCTAPGYPGTVFPKWSLYHEPGEYMNNRVFGHRRHDVPLVRPGCRHPGMYRSFHTGIVGPVAALSRFALLNKYTKKLGAKIIVSFCPFSAMIGDCTTCFAIMRSPYFYNL